ncbi:hypothetical protein [Streptomyces sp. 4F14]|uniref:hypothetical protein n=1 Tax=Streptomyces sp. 4F14 TaxID=3394380 RepID=UPI003A8B096D
MTPVTPETIKATDAWNAAVDRATAVVHQEQPGGMHEDDWSSVAKRDIIAIVLYALHTGSGTAVERVPWSQVLWWLWDDEHVIKLVEDTITGAAQAITESGGEPQHPALARWRWLNRTWDPAAPVRYRGQAPAPWTVPGPQDGSTTTSLPEARWDGMSRGIGEALPDPAVEICTSWAADVVAAVLGAERGGYSRYQRVRAIAGPFAGQGGYVMDIGWAFDDEAREATGPAGYTVDLDDTAGITPIDADLLTPASDHRWPRRPDGSLKDGPPPGFHDPLPPTPSCADDLAELLAGADNPEAVPENLRETIRAAHHHRHLDVRRLAAPRPRRATVQLLLHWYQLTEPYTGSPDGRAEIWELVITEHLRDDAPVSLLATDEDTAKALAVQRTGLSL